MDSRASARVDRAFVFFALIGAVLATSVLTWTAATASGPKTYRVGDRVTLPSEAALAAPANLVIWLSTQCEWCSKAMPTYHRLVNGPRRGRIIVMGIEPVDRLAAFARASGVEPDQVLSSETAARLVMVTPTVLLVAADGTIRSIWLGLKANEAEAEIAAALR